MKFHCLSNWRSLASLGVLSVAGQMSTNRKSTFNDRIDKSIDNLELVSVQTYFRHGARTPGHLIGYRNETIPQAHWEPHIFTRKIEAYSNYPTRVVDLSEKFVENTDSVWDIRLDTQILPGGGKCEQLTCQGQEQMFNLGRRYRQRYADLLDSGLVSEVYCRSSRIRRTLLSMKCVLTGMFSQINPNSDVINSIDIHSEDFDYEILFPNAKLCPKLDLLFDQGIKNANINEKFQECFRTLKHILNVSDIRSLLRNQPASLQIIRDDFQSRHFHGFDIGREMQGYLPTLSKLSAEQISYEVFGGPVADHLTALPFNVGLVLTDILNTFKEAKENKLSHKFKLFCCHDALIIALLVSFNIYDYDFPDFGSDFVLELYRDKKTKELWLQLLYCGEKVALNNFEPDQCTQLVPLSRVERHLERYAMSPENYEIKCKTKN